MALKPSLSSSPKESIHACTFPGGGRECAALSPFFLTFECFSVSKRIASGQLSNTLTFSLVELERRLRA